MQLTSPLNGRSWSALALEAEQQHARAAEEYFLFASDDTMRVWETVYQSGWQMKLDGRLWSGPLSISGSGTGEGAIMEPTADGMVCWGTLEIYPQQEFLQMEGVTEIRLNGQTSPIGG